MLSPCMPPSFMCVMMCMRLDPLNHAQLRRRTLTLCRQVQCRLGTQLARALAGACRQERAATACGLGVAAPTVNWPRERAHTPVAEPNPNPNIQSQLCVCGQPFWSMSGESNLLPFLSK